MHRCKASEIVRNEAYFLYAAKTNNELNAADERFSTAGYIIPRGRHDN